jgi:hypothetical protein
MTVNYTTNLALGQPVTGTESGTWGDDVNNAVTSYLDIAIAGGLSIAITTADVTLANTQGTSAATNIGSTTAQYAILNITGAKTAARNLNVPASSRHYIINNSAATGGFLLTVRGVTPTTGITLVDGEKAVVAWNGTDYVKIVSTALTNSTGTLAVANGGTGVTTSTGSGNVVLSTSPTLTTPILGTPTSGTLSGCTVDGTNGVGYINVPQNAQTGSYTLVAGDAGKHIYHAAAAAVATYTIPANGSVAYVIGTAVTFINMSTNAVTIAITTDTMYLGGTGTTGSRTLAQYGVATAVKMTSTTWVITGSGLT